MGQSRWANYSKMGKKKVGVFENTIRRWGVSDSADNRREAVMDKLRLYSERGQLKGGRPGEKRKSFTRGV